MRKQVSRKPTPFILKEDEASPAEEQVIFWIIPLKGEEAAGLISDYAGVSREARKGYRDVNQKRLHSAEQKSWLRAVKKVDNYPPSDDMLDAPGVKELIKETKTADGEKILRIPSTDDPDILMLIFEDLLTDQTQEIFDARGNAQQLTVPEKKVSSS